MAGIIGNGGNVLLSLSFFGFPEVKDEEDSSEISP